MGELTIPPSFFNIEIVLDDESTFQALSSGEKQQIYTVNSLLYHLNNLNSVSGNLNLTKYTCVSILFDEVELYFHPEMQRGFINFLFDNLQKININNITGLNFCFITHSAFILSDIPETNIMFLEVDSITKRSIQKYRRDKTFGGNIHDMLKDSFFLENGYMGEFAKKRINSAIEFLGNKIDPLQNYKGEVWDKDALHHFIGIIGEPLLRNSLNELYLKAYVLNDEVEIDKEILRLQIEKNKIVRYK